MIAPQADAGLAADPQVLLSATDRDLISLAAAGDRRAFQELVARRSASVRRLLRAMGASPEIADDCAARALIGVAERFGELRDGPAFEAAARRAAAIAFARRKLNAGRRPNRDGVGRCLLGLAIGVDMGPDEIADALGMTASEVRSGLQSAESAWLQEPGKGSKPTRD